MEANILKLLAIDDNKDSLTTLEALVRDALPGCLLLAASHGPQGVGLARAEDPDVILLQPGVDGCEVCRQLKADEPLRSIPVVFLTAARTDRADRVEALAAGANGFLSRPLDEQELVAQVRAMARLKAADRMRQPEEEPLAAPVAERIRELECELAAHKRTEARLRKDGERFRRISSMISDVAYSCRSGGDGTLPINWMVGASERVTGYSIEEIKARGCWGLLVVEDDQPLFRKYVSDLPSGTHGFCELRIRHKKGGIVWLASRVECVRASENPDVRVLYGSLTDITERKRAEQETQRLLASAQQERNRLSAVFDGISDEIWFADTQRRFTLANPSAEREFNIAVDQGHTIDVGEFAKSQDVFRPDGSHRPIEEAPPLRALAGEIVRNQEEIVRTPATGELRHRQVNAAPVRDSAGCVVGSVSVVRDITERRRAEEALRQGLAKVEASRRTLLSVIEDQKRTEEALRESETRYRAIFDESADGILMAELETKSVKYANPAACRLFGYTVDELRTMRVPDLVPRDIQERAVAEFEAQVRRERDSSLDVPILRKDGSVVYVDITSTSVNLGGVPYGVGFLRDVTGRKQAEEEKDKLRSQLNQAQKMESVGRLAGGVAHDMNNMLSVVAGNAELGLEKTAPSDPLHAHLAEILDAAWRSAAVIRQLLAFARKQTISPKVLDLNETIESMLKMLRRLIGEDVDLAWLPGIRLWPVKIDSGQVDQILANLCVNARDAIAGVGRITVESRNVTLDEADCAHRAYLVPGDFVLLAISDNGRGMDRETVGKIFDPFFTTKGAGQGTGLGLATVYGIVKQNDGFINVYSEPGQGTTFKIYLPRHAGERETIETESAAKMPPGRGETVLVVEDDPAILRIGKRMLEGLGYHVLTVSTPGEALRVAGEHAGGIHLLITDVVMPEMNGRDLADQLHTLDPNIKVLFMSGYTADVIAHQGVLEDGVNFLQKPFSGKDLAFKVRTALDQK